MSAEYNRQLAARQTEINEWSYNNKMDTLFIFQLLFISILIICILMMFSYQGTIGRPFVWYTFGCLLIVDVVVIINRAMYTNNVRDKKQWDKVVFSGDHKMTSPKGKDTDYIAKLDAAYGENGIQLSAADKSAIASSPSSSSSLAAQYGVSQKTICSIQSSACTCAKCP
jgi:hypothetical protein